MACRKQMNLLRLTLVLLFIVNFTVLADDPKDKTENDVREKWKKKNIQDYTDADVERLFDQWEVGTISGSFDISTPQSNTNYSLCDVLISL